MNEFGVDTSFGTILPASAVNDLDFFIHRIGTLGSLYSGTSAYYNKTLTPDTGCRPNITLVQTNGKPAGVYFFSYAWNATSARVEANKVCDILDSWGIDPAFGVYLDWENTPGSGSLENLIHIGITPTTALLQSIFRAWSEQVATRGYRPGVYTTQYIVNTYLTNSWVQAERGNDLFLFWLAQWDISSPSYACDLWQYYAGSDHTGVIWNGIKVDYDRVMDDKIWNYTPPTPPEPPVPPSTIPIWLKLIMKGRDKNAKCTVLL